jgi:hypothetical protein
MKDEIIPRHPDDPNDPDFVRNMQRHEVTRQPQPRVTLVSYTTGGYLVIVIAIIAIVVGLILWPGNTIKLTVLALVFLIWRLGRKDNSKWRWRR